MSTEQQRQAWRELAERLSYFGLEGRAQDAITALLADGDALTAMLEREMLRRQDAESDILRLTESDTPGPFELTSSVRAERHALAAENAKAKAALIAAAQLQREANARADAIAAELATVREELAEVYHQLETHELNA